jgi:hypothetical protein
MRITTVRAWNQIKKNHTCKQETHHKIVMFSSDAECAEQEGDHSTKGVKDSLNDMYECSL